MTQAHQQYVPLAPLYDQQLRPNGLTFPQHELGERVFSRSALWFRPESESTELTLA